jgi:hypothetical protein
MARVSRRTVWWRRPFRKSDFAGLIRWHPCFLSDQTGTGMPRFKVLKGVTHNIGHSFTSLMNYSVDDYSMGHILRFARETGLNTLTIDFVTGQGQPASLLRDPISQLPHWYTKMFWDMVQNSGSDRSLVQSATLTLKYDLQRTRPSPAAANGLQSPYICDVSVLDVRGKSYCAHFEGWWYVEKVLSPSFVPQWWNPISWFRR